MHGQFVWYELTTPDVEAAKKFYPQFTGWGVQPFDADYNMWTTGGAPFAGLFRLSDDLRQQGVPPNWLPYVEAENVNATASKCSSLGGKVMHGPEEIPGTGRFAILQDPQGATFGIYKANGPSKSWDGTPQLGRFSWHELMTTDYKKAAEFYKKLFGWQTMSEMDMGGGNMYSMFGKGSNRMFGGMFNRMPDMANMPPFWMVYILVKDVPKAVDIAKKAGGALHRGPMDIPGGVIAIMGDPQGAAFALHHATAAVEPPRLTTTPAAKPAAKAPTPAKASPAAPAKPKMPTPAKASAAAPAKPATPAPAKAAPAKAAKKATKKAAKKAKKASARKSSAKKAAKKKSSARKGPARKAAKKGAGRKGAKKGAGRKAAKKKSAKSRRGRR